ncbi:hypothetical protein [Streptomyces sp. URMC 129]|uniref:hypothetical protein n=1 Tax=Streptomyces sp. URMC 129 TaxID=3423407 RepID=UPI003F1DF409
MTTLTSPPAFSTTGPMPPTRRAPRAFFGAGVVAVCLTAVTVPLGLLDWFPLVRELRDGGGGAQTIATLVLGAALWAVLFALARLAHASRERVLLTHVRRALAARAAAPSIGEFHRFVRARLNGLPLHNSLVGRRLAALAEAEAAAGPAAATLAAHSELDHGHSEVTYGPARALVWALPALGFLGTASEMARAVDGLGSSVAATSDYTQLRDGLASGVIPALAHAFTVTLFALAASVACHTLLTWANSREQRVLLEVEDVTLDIITGVGAGVRGDGGATAPGAATAELAGHLAGLAREVGEARRVMADSATKLSALDLAHLGPLLQSVDRRLELIHGEMARDLVISRTYRPSPPRS